MGDSSLLWMVIWAVPAISGVILATAKPPEVVVWVNDVSAWWDRRYSAAKAKGGLFVGGLWRWLIWGPHKLHRWTAGVREDAARAGIRAALFFYVAGLSLFLMASAIYLAIALALLVFGFWLLSKFMGNDQSPSLARAMARARPDKPQPLHGEVVGSPREQACGCSHGCGTSAIITNYDCGCRRVEIRNDEAAGSDCTNFSDMRRICGAGGAAWR